MSVRSKPNREGEAPAEPERDGSELPEGWATTTLDTLFEFKYGKGLRQDTRDETGVVSVYGSNGVVGKHASAVTSGPTIIVGRKGSVGEVHLCPEPCWPIDTTYFIDEFPCGLPPVYWANFLKSLRLGDQGKSSAIPGISRDDIYKVIVSVPPLAEQRRIVGKLELLLGKVSSSQQRLSRVPGLLKRFRQSVLAAACSGKLTADWREHNPTDDAESDFNPDYEVPAIPDAWKWHQIQEIGDVKSGKRLPKGRELVSEDTGHLYLRAGNLKDGTVRCDGLLFVPTDVWPKIKNYTVVGGDVYITIVGACIGDAGVIPEHLSGANLTENAAKICNLRGITSHFLSNWLRSQHC